MFECELDCDKIILRSQKKKKKKKTQSQRHQDLIWFGLTILHPKVEMTKKKFPIKRWSTNNNKKKTTQNPKLNMLKYHSHIHKIELMTKEKIILIL
jgi:hypothetical protein